VSKQLAQGCYPV